MTEALAAVPAGAGLPAGPQDGLSGPAAAAATPEGEAAAPGSGAATPEGDAATPEGGVAGPEGEAERPTGPSLSPSRAADFMTCPLLYRFRVIDRLPQPPSPAAARGTLVHAVLERLFDEPAGGRTPEAAKALLGPQWERLVAEEPALAALFEAEPEHQAWLEEATRMLDRYFSLENPARIEPAYREMSVQALLESGLTLRGYIDRLDIAPTGEIRIVDYKTGAAPREEYEARALFQMKFYALALWRTGGTIPRLLQLMYLGNGEIVRYAPDERDLLATERKINALWQAIDRALTSGDWRPRPSRLCDWCSFQALCPVYGGTPPPLPEREIARPGDAAVPVAGVPVASVPVAGAALAAVSLAGPVPAQRAETG
jgi:putative RecB family exonuclease